MWLSPEFVNNLVAALNVLASQIATALDTLNFALAVDRNSEPDPRMVPRPPRNSRHGLTPPRTRTRPLDTSSTWYIPELSPPQDVRREVPGPGTEPRPGALVDRLPQPRAPAPIAANTDRGPVTTPPSTPDSDSDHSVRPHPGASSFRPSDSGTWPSGNFCKSSRLPSAMRTMNHSRRGHKVSWMRWSGAKKTRTPDPPTRLLLAPSKSPRRKSSKPGRFISNLRHAARHLCSVGAGKIFLRGCVLSRYRCLAFLVMLS